MHGSRDEDFFRNNAFSLHNLYGHAQSQKLKIAWIVLQKKMVPHDE